MIDVTVTRRARQMDALSTDRWRDALHSRPTSVALPRSLYATRLHFLSNLKLQPGFSLSFADDILAREDIKAPTES